MVRSALFPLLISVTVATLLVLFWLAESHRDGRFITTIQEEESFAWKPTVCGWLPWWDFERATKELEGNQVMFDVASPFVFMLETNGEISPKVDKFKEKLDNRSWKAKLLLIPSIYNDFDGDRVSQIINSEEKLSEHIDNITDLVLDNNFDGIEIDYEYLKSEDKDAYSQFIGLLAERLHQNGKILTLTLHPKTSAQGTWHGAQAQDWRVLGQSADILRIMAYDFTWQDASPGPLSPLNWVNEVVLYARKEIPAEKLVLGLGLYAYDWEEGNNKAQELTLSEVLVLTQDYGGEVLFDSESSSPYFTYQKDGKNHYVWFENQKSLLAKAQVARKNLLAGVCLWRLGGVPSQHYDLFKNELKK